MIVNAADAAAVVLRKVLRVRFLLPEPFLLDFSFAMIK
jgi:hypothetical protein